MSRTIMEGKSVYNNAHQLLYRSKCNSFLGFFEDKAEIGFTAGARNFYH
jgi:hypothetical protein